MIRQSRSYFSIELKEGRMWDRPRTKNRVLAGLAISAIVAIVTNGCRPLGGQTETTANNASLNGRFVLAPFPPSRTPDYDTSRWTWVLDTQTGHVTAYQLAIGHETTSAGDRIEHSTIVEVTRR